MQRGADIETKRGLRDVGEAVRRDLPVHQVEGNGCEGDGDYADQNRSAHPPDLQGSDQDDASESERSLRRPHIAESDQRRGRWHDDARIVQSDKGDEEADASGNRGVKLLGNAAQDELPDAESREEQERHPEMKTAPSAVCQGTCIFRTTV